MDKPDKKRTISVYYEEVLPSSKNTYATMRFRIGQEYEIDVPADDRLAEMVVCGELDKASKSVKQAVKYQLKRLQDPMMVKLDEGSDAIVDRKLDAMQSQVHSGTVGVGPTHNANTTGDKVVMNPEILKALAELNKGNPNANAGK